MQRMYLELQQDKLNKQKGSYKKILGDIQKMALQNERSKSKSKSIQDERYTIKSATP